MSPRLLDLQFKLAGYWTQQADEPASTGGPDNLFTASPGPGSVRGGYEGRPWSLYTWLRLHPVVRPVALGGAALIGLATARTRRGS